MEYITDKIGKHKVITKKNGIQTKILVEPSRWYKDKQKKNAEKANKKLKEEQKQMKQERKIKEKMREIAIRELKDQGEI